MKTENFFCLLNTRHKSVGIVSPRNKNLEDALKLFAILAVQATFRVVFVLDERAQCEAFIKYFHMEITKRYSTNPIVYSLTYGGTIRCMTLEEFRENGDEIKKDVIIFHKKELDINASLDISELENYKKLIVTTGRSEEYLGCIVGTYHNLTFREL